MTRFEPSAETDALATLVIDIAWRLYKKMGPGLREKHYVRFLEHALKHRGLRVRRESRYDLEFEGLVIGGALRVDLIVEETIVVEVKARDGPMDLYARRRPSHTCGTQGFRSRSSSTSGRPCSSRESGASRTRGERPLRRPLAP